MDSIARIFKALADETRLRIIGLLLTSELCVCDLTAVLALPQSTVSRHLAYLKNAGLVLDRREGVWMHYRLAAGDGIVHEDLLHLLGKDLARVPQVRSDRKLLREHLGRKRAATLC